MHTAQGCKDFKFKRFVFGNDKVFEADHTKFIVPPPGPRYMLQVRKEGWNPMEVYSCQFSVKKQGQFYWKPNLIRCDSLKFDLVVLTQAFYVLHTPIGLKLISVRALEQSADTL